MPVFIKGFPRCTNANDMADSPVIAAWLALVSHPQAIDMKRYFVNDNNPVRCPSGKSILETSPRCFSRDQLVMLAAGMWAQGQSYWYYDKAFAPNDLDEVTLKWKIPDFLSVSVRNHLKLGAGLAVLASWLGYKFLELDIWFASRTDHEHNQLQAMCIVAGPKYVKKYVAKNPNWRQATYKYWADDTPGAYNRGEPELAAMIVKKIEELAL